MLSYAGPKKLPVENFFKTYHTALPGLFEKQNLADFHRITEWLGFEGTSGDNLVEGC